MYRRVLAYVRVSSAGQERDGTSLDGQREEILRYCTAQGLPEPRLVVEVESAGAEKLDRRAKLRALLADVADGDLVLVTKQDRWSRDVLFYVQSTREIMARGARFFSLAERFDPSTPEGAFAATIMAATAEHEHARIKARTVGRRKELRAQGFWVEGPPPFGYRVRDRRLVVEPREAEIVGGLFKRCIAGASTAQLVEWIREHAPKLAYRKSLSTMLHARWYVGEMRGVDGVWRPTHEPIVERGLFDRAAAALVSRRLGGMRARSDSRTADWLCRGLVSCGVCGARMGGAYRGERSYLACRARLAPRGGRPACGAPYAQVPLVDAQLAERARARLLELRKELAQGEAPKAAQTTGTQAKIERVQAKRARTLDLMTDGTIESDDGRARLAKIDADIATIASDLRAEESQARAARPEVRREVLREVRELERAWKAAPMPKRREILAKLAERITVRDGKVDVAWRSVAELARN